MTEPKQTQPLVAILMGSGSDWPVIKESADTLARFSVPVDKDTRPLISRKTPPHEFY